MNGAQFDTEIVSNRKLRIKLTNRCNLNCPFCHAEGAPQVNDISLQDTNFLDSLQRLRANYDSVHLTGGEPTLYPDLLPLLQYLKSLGYKVAITTNGLFDQNRTTEYIEYLDYFNVSLHSLSSTYLRNFSPSNSDSRKILERILENISFLQKSTSVRINTVISGVNKMQELELLHSFVNQNNIPWKLVPDWRFYEESREYILRFLRQKEYEAYKIIKILPGSNVRKLYRNHNGILIEFKDIEPFRPDFLCGPCKMKPDCIESFAFVRLEQNPVKFRLCIHKEPLSLHTFFSLFDSYIKELLP